MEKRIKKIEIKGYYHDWYIPPVSSEYYNSTQFYLIFLKYIKDYDTLRNENHFLTRCLLQRSFNILNIHSLFGLLYCPNQNCTKCIFGGYNKIIPLYKLHYIINKLIR